LLVADGIGKERLLAWNIKKHNFDCRYCVEFE
jgi:hypothetical protein